MLVLLFGLILILIVNDYLFFEFFEGGILVGVGVIIINVMMYFNLILKYVVVIIFLVGL